MEKSSPSHFVSCFKFTPAAPLLTWIYCTFSTRMLPRYYILCSLIQLQFLRIRATVGIPDCVPPSIKCAYAIDLSSISCPPNKLSLAADCSVPYRERERKFHHWERSSSSLPLSSTVLNTFSVHVIASIRYLKWIAFALQIFSLVNVFADKGNINSVESRTDFLSDTRIVSCVPEGHLPGLYAEILAFMRTWKAAHRQLLCVLSSWPNHSSQYS